jgi:hypothetical protein
VKHAIQMCALAVALVVIGAPKVTSAQSATIVDEVLEDWLYLKETILQLVGYMPADKFTYVLPLSGPVKGIAVDPAQEAFGKRVLDIALVNVRLLRTLGGKAKAPVIDDTEPMTSKEASTKAVTDSFDYGVALLKEQTDQTMWEKVNASTLGPSSRVRVYRYLQSHMREIDGQLVIYIRLSGAVLPSIVG